MSSLRSWRSASIVAVVVVGVLMSGTASAEVRGGGPSRALFDGQVIDLSDGWAGAGACAELAGVVECFSTERALLEVHPELVASAEAIESTCSSALRLYRSAGFTGGSLYLTTRTVIHNLSSYGFDNDTSSYVVGACAAAFYSGSNLSGSQYPGSTAAYASASAMLSGWNNVVSSVIIG